MQRGHYSAGGLASAGAAATAIAEAIKASGVIIRVEFGDFLGILKRQEGPLVVHATGGFFNTSYQYLTSYKGLAFYTRTQSALELPGTCEVIKAERIWVP